MKIEIDESNYTLERNIIDVEESIEKVKETLFYCCIDENLNNAINNLIEQLEFYLLPQLKNAERIQ